MNRFHAWFAIPALILPIAAQRASAASVATTPTPAPAASPAPDPAGVEFFEKHVRPVLVEQCYKCHSAASEKLKANLYLDTAAGAEQGGDTGPAVVPGHPEKSLLIEAIKYGNDDMKMPPKNQLPANVVADLTKWVQMGAPWPQDRAAVAAKPAWGKPAGPVGVLANYDKLRREHWAWQPLHDSAPPAVSNTAWPYNDVDHYVLAKLEERGLRPVADADRATLIRRVTFDLTGLPPTPEDVGSFQADTAPDAYAKLVDRLLASRAYGEKWARHWLDVARYGESTGSSRNVPYAYAWRYRDYVINAFNADKPYNRFITEQIAGDLMPYRNGQQHNEQLIATGFLAIGVKDLAEKDREKFVMDNVDEQIDVTTRSIMALTVACARCHDHKFDPIPTADYYAMAGIFKSTEILAGVEKNKKGAGKKNYGAPKLLMHLDAAALSATPAVSPGDNRQELGALETQLEKARAELQQLRKSKNEPNNAEARKSKRQEFLAIQSQIEALNNGSQPSAQPVAGASAMGVADRPDPSDASICLHGEPRDLGPQVARGFVSVVPVHLVSNIDRSHSGRLELAQWLTSPDNPLTPRVMVNRIWSHLFGEGIVRTVDNFGSTGEAPADPELLDHLAAQFIRQDWSVKQMVREIVLSHAYQLSSESNPIDFNSDPGDRMVWRMPSRRLDAEEIRDAMLAIGGKLDTTPVMGSVASGLPGTELRLNRLGELSGNNDHRSVYLPILRDLVPPVLDLFDFAEPTMVIGSRDNTTVATQALFMMNDPFVTSQAEHFAERLQNATGTNDAGRVDLAYRLALSRPATEDEKSRVLKYITDFQHKALYATKDTLKSSRSDAWASFCQAMLASGEFRYLN